MTLGELIKFLQEQDQDIVPPIGFGNAHSYRGYYECLAFEPKKNVSIADMLKEAEGALGQTFTGWKGGEYKMGEHTEVWLANHGCSGEMIGMVLLSYMVGKPFDIEA